MIRESVASEHPRLSPAEPAKGERFLPDRPQRRTCDITHASRMRGDGRKKLKIRKRKTPLLGFLSVLRPPLPGQQHRRCLATSTHRSRNSIRGATSPTVWHGHICPCPIPPQQPQRLTWGGVTRFCAAWLNEIGSRPRTGKSVRPRVLERHRRRATITSSRRRPRSGSGTLHQSSASDASHSTRDGPQIAEHRGRDL